MPVFGLGRNVARVARIAERPEFTIIVATGLSTLNLEKLIAAGSYLGLDQFGDSRDPVRVKTAAALCRRGYAARLALSRDAGCGGDIEPGRALREWRYGIAPTKIIPALPAAGVPDDDLDLMLVRNPRAIFGALHRAVASTG